MQNEDSQTASDECKLEDESGFRRRISKIPKPKVRPEIRRRMIIFLQVTTIVDNSVALSGPRSQCRRYLSSTKVKCVLVSALLGIEITLGVNAILLLDKFGSRRWDRQWKKN
jgi:hypothetical protein